MKRGLGGIAAAALAAALAGAAAIATGGLGESRSEDGTAGPVVVAAVGDTMLASHLAYYLARFGPAYPWGDLTRELAADVLVCNLEAPIADRGRAVVNKEYTFRAPGWTTPALAEAGFDVCTLANNHMLDYGPAGLESTLAHLAAAGIAAAGAGPDLAAARRPAIVEVPGEPPLKVAVLAYSKTFPFDFFATRERAGTAPGDDAYLAEDIAAARAAADVVIVSVHWSAELLHAVKAYQQDWAHAAIDAGADLVLGHHPHVVQPLEVYRGRLIVYSLGNFVFASYSRAAREALLVRAVFDRDGQPAGAELVPLDVDNVRVNFRPRPLRGAAARDFLAWLAELSAAHGTEIEIRGERGWIELCR